VRRLLTAVAFLTAIPVRMAADAADVGRATALFPLVGGALGALAAGVAALLGRALPSPLTAALVVALGAALTRALHLDGLADTVDGLGGGRDRAHALAIMKDHSVGAFGATALVLLLLVKVAAVQALLERGGGLAWLPVAGALSRWIAVPLARLPSARPSGLGGAIAPHVGRLEVGIATALALGLALLLAGWRGAAVSAAVAALGVAGAALCMRRLGGVTGDTLGAAVELAEGLALVLAVWLR